MLLTTLAHNQHDVIDVIWRLPVWNVKIRHYLALCTLQFWSNLTEISFPGKHFNHFWGIVVNMTCRISHFQDGRSFHLNPLVSLLVDLYVWNEIQIKLIIYTKFGVYIINSITKPYILNIKIRPLVTEYALMIKLVDRTSSAHQFNPYAYFGHSWSYFDIQNLRLVILYLNVVLYIYFTNVYQYQHCQIYSWISWRRYTANNFYLKIAPKVIKLYILLLLCLSFLY